MTATKPPNTYQSGHCDVAAHDHCRGAYTGVTCTCPCHTEPPPPPPPVAVAPVLPVRHCPTCTCEGHQP